MLPCRRGRRSRRSRRKRRGLNLFLNVPSGFCAVCRRLAVIWQDFGRILQKSGNWQACA